MKIREIMSTTLTVAEAEATLGEAATLMGEHRVGSVVVFENDHMVGIFTERDVVRALSNTHDAPVRPVAEWMTKNPRTIDPGAEVQEALAAMIEGSFRHLPVLEDGRVVGMVSIRDVARALNA
ncbi:MAG: CBS domain-containing protein [Actinomycetota bacterium]